jgi:hypothetical protein
LSYAYNCFGYINVPLFAADKGVGTLGVVVIDPGVAKDKELHPPGAAALGIVVIATEVESLSLVLICQRSNDISGILSHSCNVFGG